MADLFEAIKGFEGFSPRASWDYKQNSVGWGTRARYPGETIDPREADSRLQDEIAKAQSIVDRHAPNLDAGTRSALTSLTYNAGDAWTRSGLGDAVRSGDMDKARSLFVQYNKAGGQTLPGLVNRRQQEVAWFGNPDGPAAQPMALGGPPQSSQAPQVRGSTAMAGMEDTGWGSLIGRFANGVNNAVMSPMFQSGAAMVNAGAEGKNIGAGFLAGGEAAANASKNQFALQEARRKMQQMQMQEQYLSGVDTSDPKWAGIDPRLIEMAKRTNNIGFLEEAAKAKIAADRQAYINPLDKQLKEAQLQQIKVQTPEWRAENAERFGIAKGSPDYVPFVINGTVPAKGDGLVHLKDGETVWQKDQVPGGGFKLNQVAGNEKTPSGYKTTPDGNLQAIPGGPADVKMNEKRQQDYASTQSMIQSMDALDRKANDVLTHPGLSWNFGLAGMIPNRPGSSTSDALGELKTLTVKSAFSTLQDMRNSSKTGGALGAVSDREQAMLATAITNLEKSNSYEQVVKNIKDLQRQIAESRKRIIDTYNDHWNNSGIAAKQPMGQPAAQTQQADPLGIR